MPLQLQRFIVVAQCAAREATALQRTALAVQKLKMEIIRELLCEIVNVWWYSISEADVN
jgi:hypothetical protein